MPYEFFEHKADIGIRGTGRTLEEAFEEAAKAMFNVMFDISKVGKNLEIEIRCDAPNLEELFIEWLNALLAERDINDAVFAHFKVEKLEQLDDGRWVLEAKAYGERFDAEKHKPEVEVKAATYSQLRVYFNEEEQKWIAQCVLDV